jgi:hypothetical protein
VLSVVSGFVFGSVLALVLTESAERRARALDSAGALASASAP